jgi:cysteine synthase B
MTENIVNSSVAINQPSLRAQHLPIGGVEVLVGNTPLIPLRHLSNKLSPFVQIWSKAEWFNPAGSIKARPALNIIQTALANGSLTPKKRLLDATSGNMGIAYATFGAAMGIQVTLAIPANASQERLMILRALGAELILTDPMEGTDGAILRAQALYKKQPERYFYANQYDNPANWRAHYETTGPEVVGQTQGRLTHFVAGMGTSGTMMGVGRYLRQYNPQIQLVAVGPDSPFHGLEGLKHMASAIRPAILEPSLPDLGIVVRTEDAFEMTRRLAREEGLFVGISSGANVAAALRVAEQLNEGLVVTIFPDAGYKYLSDEALWEK